MVRQKLYIFVSTLDEPECTLLLKRRVSNELPEWCLLHLLVEYEQGDQTSFNSCVYHKLKERIQLDFATIKILDVSKQNDLWAVLCCNNSSFTTFDPHCIETHFFPYERIKLLSINDNLKQFIELYPTYEHLKNRQDQLDGIWKH